MTRTIDCLDEAVLLGVLSDVRDGDFSVRMPLVWTGVAGKIADRLNEVIAANEVLGAELERVSRVVGKEGRLSQRMASNGTAQGWSQSIESVNDLIEDLVRPTSEMQRVIGAVADGDLSKKITADVHGEMLELKNTINGMVDQLNRFISEVTRVAREVGTEGRLGQAAAVTIEVGGVWKDLTDNVNLMAGNLTGQVRNIAEVTTAVANGDLSKKISADVKGEFLELKNTVNAMVDQLNRFASEVTRVAREVGVEGKLGGQAESAEVAGVWKDLTDNVNQLAANLTNQVRAIADVATGVTDGDLTRQVSVEASGEVAVLKDKLNEMIRNLRETTRQNTEQDWLKTNLERFTRMLQGQRDLPTVSSMILSELAPLVSAQHGAFYILDTDEDRGEPVLRYQAGYGFKERKHLASQFRLGEGLVGQCAQEKERILLTDVPGDYVTINSGLGESAPLNIIVLPILFEGAVRAVVELASFSRFSLTHQSFLDQLTVSIGLVINTIEANTVTEDLLLQAQSQAKELQSRQEELQSRQEELRSSNEDLAEQAVRLAEQNSEVQRKNSEVELAKRLVEEKAEQLAVSSKYKSEFFSNMSHELRTPLNSLLILASELKHNSEQTLTEAQVEYASIIHSCGTDLLRLLNDILDLAKVESGTVTLEISDMPLADLKDGLESDFIPVASAQGLAFSVELAPDLPATIATDPGRLRQVLKNLLSNAFKFTEEGEVRVSVSRVHEGWGPTNTTLVHRNGAIAFTIRDTGIGVTQEMQQRIFEAFAQADGTTARQYGGTGLGLSISLQLVGLLGGEITLTSTLDEGSTFVVYLPPAPTGYAGPPAVADQPSEPDGPSYPRAPQLVPASSNGSAVTDLVALTVLVIDDDVRNIFAIRTLLEGGNVRVLSAERGKDGIAILERTPDIGLVLVDMMMPIMDGYATMRAMRRLRAAADFPIIGLTATVGEGELDRCLEAGATAYIAKPVDSGTAFLRELAAYLPAPARGSGEPVHDAEPSAPARVLPPVPGQARRAPADPPALRRQQATVVDLEGMKMLVVDDDPRNILAVTTLLDRGHIDVVTAGSGKEGLAILERTADIDLVLVDMMMPVLDGYDTMRAMRKLPSRGHIPLVAVTATVGDGECERCVEAGASLYLSKPLDNGTDFLVALAACFPSRPGVAPTPETPAESIAARNGAAIADLEGMKVLVVDDDLSHVFAVTTLLERGSIDVISAVNGAHGIAILEQDDDIDLVLMDITMPVMDGYATMRAMRELPERGHIPLVALTSSRGEGERERCINAGASAYLTKPIDNGTGFLLSLAACLPTAVAS